MSADELDQLRRYGDALDRAAEVSSPLPAELAPRPAAHHRLLLAAAAVLAVLGLAAGLAVAGDDDPAPDELTTADPEGSTSTVLEALGAGGVIEGDEGCAVEVLSGPDELVAGPAPDDVAFLQGVAAHLTTDDDLLAEVHVPGDAMTDLLGEDTEQIKITAGTATLWRAAVAPGDHRIGDFSQVRYFPGGQDRCGSFTVTAAGGTVAENDELAIRIANRLRPLRVVGVPAPPLPTTPPPADGGAALSEIVRAAPGDFHGFGPDGTGGMLDLKAGREPLAKAIRARYGERIRITVGGYPWPLTDPTPSPTCTNVVLSRPVSVDGLTATVALDASSRSVGTEFTGKVMIRNETERSASTSFGSFIPAFLLDDQGRVAGYFDGAVALMARGLTVESGTSSQAEDLIAGVASCDPANGTAVQPGTYQLIVQLDFPGHGTVTSNPVVVTVHAP